VPSAAGQNEEASGQGQIAHEQDDLGLIRELMMENHRGGDAEHNNPTGEVTPLHKLWAWHSELAARGGWLIVDEAFMDATPTDSLLSTLPRFAQKALPPGLIVLRGLGKFFGLAGARVGFVGASPSFLEDLEDALGPWTISAPSRWLAIQALRDISLARIHAAQTDQRK